MPDETVAALDEQPRPPTRCPECGGEPAPEVSHRLSATGYLHDDQTILCSDCGHTWECGVPIGEFDRAVPDALRCGCGGWRLVHWVEVTGGSTVTLACKCPECYSFRKERRSLDDDGRALVGYPQITGQTEGATPLGYTDES